MTLLGGRWRSIFWRLKWSRSSERERAKYNELEAGSRMSLVPKNCQDACRMRAPTELDAVEEDQTCIKVYICK